MSKFTVTADTRAVRAALSRVPNTVRREVLARAVLAGAEPIAASARDKAPVRRGVLRREIKARLEQRSFGTGAAASVSWRGGRASRTQAFHGMFAELGTPVRTRKSGATTGAMPATPFLRPAFDEKVDAARREAQRVLAESVMALAR